HAVEMVRYGKTGGFRFTAPLFDHVAGERPETDSETTDLDDFYSSLDNNCCFDPVRDTEEFRSLYA
ncbi:MAG: hypothetical protein IKR53_06245, partial [Clostridia bacterium]|nr:hypothetical protein [Clostridia bacterium]